MVGVAVMHGYNFMEVHGARWHSLHRRAYQSVLGMVMTANVNLLPTHSEPNIEDYCPKAMMKAQTDNFMN